MAKLLTKIKNLFKRKNLSDKVFLLLSWPNGYNNGQPTVIKTSNSSNLLYHLMDFDKNQEVVSLSEYQEILKQY